MTITATTRITGELSIKRVGAYFKQSHKEHPIRVERRDDGSFFLADGLVAVAVPQHPDLFPFTHIDATWERATFYPKEMHASEGGPDIVSLWDTLTQDTTLATLTLTHYLWEIPGARNKSGALFRKFTQGERDLYIKRTLCDLLSPDLDELEGFCFEQAGKDKPVRVAARNGFVAILMPHVKLS